jgi:hypothetical protein
MRYLLIFLCLKASFALCAQESDPWLKFVDPKTRLAGYRDAGGTVRIPPKFENYFVADTFHNIIAVREPVNKTYDSYYLLKNGDKAGIDSLYLFDGYDCESEGMILYQDHKTDYVGYLDINGTPVIPAVYNTATCFRNGLAQALVYAKRLCWEGGYDTVDCERLTWEGGTGVLINKKNEMLAEGLPSDFYQNVDWYSVMINKVPKDTSIYLRIDGKNGNTYYFIQFEKEFKNWFATDFLSSLATEKSKYIFPEVMVWGEKTNWHNITREEYMKSYSGVLKKERFETGPTKKISFGLGEFNDYVMTSPIYRRFYNACGKFDKYRYPLFVVTISYYKKNQQFDHSESFEFIRTAHGYYLMESPTKM